MKFMEVLAKQKAEQAPYMKVGFARTVEAFSGRVEKWVNTWPLGQGHDDVIRCSGLYYMCPREFVLNYWEPKPSSSFDFNSYLRMGVGTYLHAFLQDTILGSAGVLYGNWRNVTTNMVTRGFIPDPEAQIRAFVTQGTLPYTYVEDRIWDEHHRLRGHTDGILDVKRFEAFCEYSKSGMDFIQIIEELSKIPEDLENQALLEIKTTSSRLLGGINSAKDIAGYYQMQAVAYQKLTNINRTVFWYFERNDLASKALVHEYSETWWEEVVQKINIVWTSIRDHTLPDAFMKCMSPQDARAKKCVHAATCWTPPIGPDNMEEYIEKCKADQPERQWLDLTGWEPK